MKTIKFLFLLLITISIFSCAKKQENSDVRFYYNEDFVIVKVDEVRKTWLIQKQGTDYFSEIYVENDPLNIKDEKGYDCNSGYHTFNIPISIFYNKKLGDIVHFDYILKDRFFTIKNFKNPLNSEENGY